MKDDEPCVQKCKDCRGELCPYGVQFMTNQQLVEALLNRSTFLGIVVRSKEEVLPGTKHQDFVVSCNQQIDPLDLSLILTAAAQNILKNANIN
jgi:hypothetical protein